MENKEIQKDEVEKEIDYVDVNGISVPQGICNVKKLVNHIYFAFIFIILVQLFLKSLSCIRSDRIWIIYLGF